VGEIENASVQRMIISTGFGNKTPSKFRVVTFSFCVEKIPNFGEKMPSFEGKMPTFGEKMQIILFNYKMFCPLLNRTLIKTSDGSGSKFFNRFGSIFCDSCWVGSAIYDLGLENFP